MEKRFQVFVSSTYTDLIDERQKVFHTLMEMGCIPAGMELFSAADEDQFEFIKKIIDDCDYYLLMIGGRYGSLAEDQFSFTEKEFDYAISIGLKVVVLVHSSPESIPSGKTDQNPKLKQKLEAFKKKAMTGRMVDFWDDAKDLPGRVSINVNKAMRMYPAEGWVRGNQVASQEILEEINNLRKEKQLLSEELQKLQSETEMEISGLVNFNEEHTVHLEYEIGEKQPSANLAFTQYSNKQQESTEIHLTWKKIFMLLSDDFLYERSEGRIQRNFANSISKDLEFEDGFALISKKITTENMKAIFTQLMAYGLIDYTASENSRYLNWFLTRKGQKSMLENRAILKTDS